MASMVPEDAASACRAKCKDISDMVRLMLLAVGSFLFTSSMLMNVCYGIMTGIGTNDRWKKKATNTMSHSDEEPMLLIDVRIALHNWIVVCLRMKESRNSPPLLYTFRNDRSLALVPCTRGHFRWTPFLKIMTESWDSPCPNVWIENDSSVISNDLSPISNKINPWNFPNASTISCLFNITVLLVIMTQCCWKSDSL
jgi:hypothetical protein